MKKKKKQTLHDKVIRVLLKDDLTLRTSGFRAAVLDVLDHTPKDYLAMIPDAFSVNERLKEICAVEVEDKHPVPLSRLDSYGDLWFEMDSSEWNLRLILVDRMGVGKEVDLCDVFYARCLPRMAGLEPEQPYGPVVTAVDSVKVW